VVKLITRVGVLLLSGKKIEAIKLGTGVKVPDWLMFRNHLRPLK